MRRTSRFPARRGASTQSTCETVRPSNETCFTSACFPSPQLIVTGTPPCICARGEVAPSEDTDVDGVWVDGTCVHAARVATETTAAQLFFTCTTASLFPAPSTAHLAPDIATAGPGEHLLETENLALELSAGCPHPRSRGAGVLF